MNRTGYTETIFRMMFVLFTFLAATTVSAASIKCWTNEEGVRACGAVVPPEYAQQEHEEINKQGMVVNVQERAKTDAEIAEDKRQAELAEEERKLAEEKSLHDSVLLQTFAKVEDLEAARDDKIAAIESSITLAEKRRGKIMADLDNRMKAAADEERKGKNPNEALLKDIESLKRQASNNQEYIEQQQLGIEDVRTSYSADIERFKELKGIE